MSSSLPHSELPPAGSGPFVKEEHIEYGFIGKLQSLKYDYRDDIRDRAALEANFREKFEALNRVKLTDAEFARLLDEIVTPDVFTAAKTLRSINAFTRDDGKADIVVAKNYLTEDEIDTLNRLVVIFLETAELRAKGKQETRMTFWKQNVDQIVTSNGFPLLTHAGTITHVQMEARTGALYLQFDQDRKRAEAIAADQQDEADLQALETKIKRRPKK